MRFLLHRAFSILALISVAIVILLTAGLVIIPGDDNYAGGAAVGMLYIFLMGVFSVIFLVVFVILAICFRKAKIDLKSLSFFDKAVRIVSAIFLIIFSTIPLLIVAFLVAFFLFSSLCPSWPLDSCSLFGLYEIPSDGFRERYSHQTGPL